MKKNNGITLITLVITIIVMLIIAGIGVATFSSSNRNVLQRLSGYKNTLAGNLAESQKDINDLRQIANDVDDGNGTINVEFPDDVELEIIGSTDTSIAVRGKVKYSDEINELYYTIRKGSEAENANAEKSKADKAFTYTFSGLANSTDYVVSAFKINSDGSYTKVKEENARTEDISGIHTVVIYCRNNDNSNFSASSAVVNNLTHNEFTYSYDSNTKSYRIKRI